MRTFWAFIRKEFYHILRDSRTLIVLFGMPVVQVILFGYAINTDVQSAKMAVYDKAKDEASASLIHRMYASGYFEQAPAIAHSNQLHEAFQSGAARIVLEIPPDFSRDVDKGDAAISLMADASNPNMASIVTSYAQSIATQWANDRHTPIQVEQIEPQYRMHYNASMKSVYLFVPGVLTVILMLVSAMLTSISIAREKELGTMEILLVSPLRPGLIIIGKVLPYLVLSVFNAMLVFVVGRLVFHVPMRGSYFLLIMEGMLFITTALSVGLMISNVAKSQQVALMLSLFVLMMPTILLSGFIFPVSSMPWPLQVLANIMPAKHFIIILRGIMLKGIGLAALWKETLILTGMTAALLIVSIKKFKIRLS